jgi:hypothetical protein
MAVLMSGSLLAYCDCDALITAMTMVMHSMQRLLVAVCDVQPFDEW